MESGSSSDMKSKERGIKKMGWIITSFPFSELKIKQFLLIQFLSISCLTSIYQMGFYQN